jgi:hypothetical protein
MRNIYLLIFGFFLFPFAVLGQEKIKSKNAYSKARGRIIAGYIL